MPPISRAVAVTIGLAGALGAAFLASLVFGSTFIPLSDVLAVVFGSSADHSSSAAVIASVRLPRALTAALAGAALGVAGLQMQTLFRNPLVDPFALGISAGASLGVALVVLGSGVGATAMFGGHIGLAADAVATAAAIAGAAIVLAIVLTISNRIAEPTVVLILGLMFGYTVAALVPVLIGASQPERLQQWATWQFGSFSGVTRQRLVIFAPVVLLGILVACSTTKQLNALLLGENYARSMGLAVRRARMATMFGASVLGAVVTAFCGPISFLGIAVPHLCRGLLRTSDHRALVPAVALLGAVVALTAQLLALLPGPSGVLPLNAVTSLIGAPIVAVVVVRSRRGVFAA